MIMERSITDASAWSDSKNRFTRTDRSSEHMSEKSLKKLWKNGIRVKSCCVQYHYQNRVAEKVITDVADMARCMLNHMEVSRDIWGWTAR